MENGRKFPLILVQMDRRGIRYLGVGVELFDECEENSNKTEVLNSGKLEAEFSSGYGSKPLSGFHGEMEKFSAATEKILLPFERGRGKKMKFPTARKLRRAGNGKKFLIAREL